MHTTTPKKVAIMTDWVGSYQHLVLDGFLARLTAAGLSTVTYVGRELFSPLDIHRPGNRVYDLLDSAAHQGIFVLTSTVGNGCSDADLLGFLERFAGIPVVGFGRKLPGIPTVQVCNRSGMQELMEHVIVRQGHRRLVFVRGVQDNPEAQAREQVFLEAVKRHHLEVPESHLLNGGFYAPATRNAFCSFLQQHRGEFDAVVCANDDMALAVMAVLEDHGLQVPDDVAVVGFDNVQASAFASPPLTTVDQPIHQMGIQAAEMLMQLMEGVRAPDRLVPSSLVVRASCGPAHPAKGTGQEDRTALQTQVAQQRYCQHLGHVGTALGAHDTLEGLSLALKQSLPSIGLEKFILALHAGPEDGADSPVRVHISRGAEGLEGQTVPVQQLLGAAELQQGHWQVHPMHIKAEQYGFLMLSEPPGWGGDVELLRYIVTRSIHHMVKTQALQKHAEELERQVQERTRQLHEANQELQRLLLQDGLTRVYNRVAFDDYLQRMWEDHLRTPDTLSVILCDVDFFKKYNDSLGHLAGDACLKQVASALQQAVSRPGDMVARYGGEEFVVVLPHTGQAGALQVARRIQERVHQLNLPHPTSEVADRVTLSLGVASAVPEPGRVAVHLLDQADQALYRAKRQQRNAIAVWSDPVLEP